MVQPEKGQFASISRAAWGLIHDREAELGPQAVSGEVPATTQADSAQVASSGNKVADQRGGVTLPPGSIRDAKVSYSCPVFRNPVEQIANASVIGIQGNKNPVFACVV